MKRNVGSGDRVLRTAVGVILIAAALFGPETPWGWLGVLPLGTGLAGWCAVYRLLGIGTADDEY